MINFASFKTVSSYQILTAKWNYCLEMKNKTYLLYNDI